MECLVPDRLFTDFAPVRMAGMPVGRRTAVLRRADGRLVVWSPLPATPERVAALAALGEPAAFVVASRFHDLHFPGWFGCFPGARFRAPAGVRRDHPDWPLEPLRADDEALAGLRFTEIAGMPRVGEHVFLDPATRTLVVADLFFHVPRFPRPWERLLGALAGIGGPPRPSRLFRAMIRDRDAFAASLREVLSGEFDRIVPGHGECILAGGNRVLREAFAPWLSPAMT